MYTTHAHAFRRNVLVFNRTAEEMYSDYMEIPMQWKHILNAAWFHIHTYILVFIHKQITREHIACKQGCYPAMLLHVACQINLFVFIFIRGCYKTASPSQFDYFYAMRMHIHINKWTVMWMCWFVYTYIARTTSNIEIYIQISPIAMSIALFRIDSWK